MSSVDAAATPRPPPSGVSAHRSGWTAWRPGDDPGDDQLQGQVPSPARRAEQGGQAQLLCDGVHRGDPPAVPAFRKLDTVAVLTARLLPAPRFAILARNMRRTCPEVPLWFLVLLRADNGRTGPRCRTRGEPVAARRSASQSGSTPRSPYPRCTS